MVISTWQIAKSSQIGFVGPTSVQSAVLSCASWGHLLLKSLTNVYFEQVAKRNTVVVASVIDKRYLRVDTTFKMLHQKAYELLLERIQGYMNDHHPQHQALIIMDDMDKDLNRAVAMQHASFLRSGNWNTTFQNIVEYPFFTRSELSNGV